MLMSFFAFSDKKCQEYEYKTMSLQTTLDETRPQLSGFEASMGQLRSELAQEKQARREAEMAQHQAETRARLAESSLLHLREEKDNLLEELAFVGADVDELKQELSDSRLKHAEEMERLEIELKRQLAVFPKPMANGFSKDHDNHSNNHDDASQESTLLDGIQEEDEEETAAIAVASTDNNKHEEPAKSNNNEHEQAQYIKSLEDELELVTEQLIETQQKLSDAEFKCAEAVERAKSSKLHQSELEKSSKEALEEATIQANWFKASEEEKFVLQTQLEALQEQFALTQQELEASREELAILPELEVELESLQTQLQEKTTQATQLQTLVESLQSQHDQLQLQYLDKESIDKSDYLAKSIQANEAAHAEISNLRLQLAVAEEKLQLKQPHDDELQKLQCKLAEMQEKVMRQEFVIQASPQQTDNNQIQEQLELAQKQLLETRQELDRIQAQYQTAKDELANKKAEIQQLLQQDVQAPSTPDAPSPSMVAPSSSPTSFSSASRLALRSPTHDVFHLTHDDDSAADDAAKQSSKQLALKTQWMRQHNAQLLHQLLALQGNIQVCCRIRPALRGEAGGDHAIVVEPLSETEVGVITNPLDSESVIATQWKSFTFDKVWGPDASQFDVFLDVEPLALSVVDGYNACIFAYGQTGSGKTFTMEGAVDNWGISQRTISKIFHLLKQRQTQQPDQFAFDIEVGMLEIYNENIYDLLLATGKIDTTTTSSLDIRRDANGRTTVPDLTKEPVKSLNDVMTLLQRGNANRATASTHMNEHSSRSHMVLQVQVTTKTLSPDDADNIAPAVTGSLYLVDLAGSERVRKSNVSGKELREAQYINKSLSALGDVMEALDKKSSHIPYRNSKLTHLLQDSLTVGGGSKTLMVVTVCPTFASSKETQYALQFAARARNVHLGKAQRNNVVSTKNLEERIKVMSNEHKLLQRAKDKSEELLAVLKRENANLQDKLNSSQSVRTKSHDDARALVALRKTNNEISLKFEKEKHLTEKQAAQVKLIQQELKQCQDEIAQLTRDRDLISKTLEERDSELSEMRREVRKAKDALAAEKIRARRASLLHSSPSVTTTTLNVATSSIAPPLEAVPPSVEVTLVEGSDAPKSSIPPLSKPRQSLIRPPTVSLLRTPSTTRKPRHSSFHPSPNTTNMPKMQPLDGAASIREKCFAILQKHDPQKAARLDQIMERFKGREQVLLDKIRLRYAESHVSTQIHGSSGEDGSDKWETESIVSSASSVITSPKIRSEHALRKHKARMLRKSVSATTKR